LADPELNFGRGIGRRGAKVQKVPKLAKHSVKQRKTTEIGGGANAPFALPLDPLLRQR